MALIVTDAIVLHAFDYLETSRIVRLVTREAGVQSVMARGARGSKKRFGSALDLFAQGEAQIQMKMGRDLHTLVSFDAGRSRPEFSVDLARFAAASAFAECVLRVLHDEAAPTVFDRVVQGFDQIAHSAAGNCVSATLGALWRVVSDVGFSPSLEVCVNCHRELDPGEDTVFSHLAGGAVCSNCAHAVPARRRLPASARASVILWLAGGDAGLTSEAEGRSHQRLFREFVAQHVPHARELSAFSAWESGLYG